MLTQKQKYARICLIAPSTELYIFAKHICEQLPWQDQVEVYQSLLDRVPALAAELVEGGAKVIISRKGTYESLLKLKLPAQVVAIESNLSDYIPILRRLRADNDKPAFFYYGNSLNDLPALCKLMNIQASFFPFTRFEDGETCVLQALGEHCTVGVGGSTTAFFAQRHGLRHCIVESSEEAIVNALQFAWKILELQREEEKKQLELRIRMERYGLIFEYTHDGIIAVDYSGRIELMNSVARDIVGIREGYEGRDIEEILPNTRMNEILRSGEAEIGEIMEINNTLVVTNRVPIMVDEKVEGAVATFTDVKTIQSNELRTRQHLRHEGFVAKYHFSDITSASQKIVQCKKIAADYARSDFTVMIHGETGSGKEMFAQSIHNAGPRAAEPFVAINCSALPGDLLESELFGYEEGAFTGAARGGKRGVFELAEGGSLFLDEIGDISVRTQVLLLRAIEEKEIRRIGGSRNIPVDLRIIAASNKDLREEIKQGRFREDLFYRLNVLSLSIPPLRERCGDAEIICQTILDELNQKYKTRVVLDFKVLNPIFSNYSWPGNVRELRNCIERLFVSSVKRQNRLTARDYEELLPELLAVPEGNYTSSTVPPICTPEEDLIRSTLAANQGRIGETAEALGCSRSTLWRKLKKYGISV